MSEGKSDAPLMVGVSGLRGIVGESLTPEVVVRFAGAFAAWVMETSVGPHGEPATVFVGRDGRAGGEAIQSLIIGTLLSAGCNVLDLGVVMTPTVGAITHHDEADGFEPDAGIIVTASHNPSEWNGIKLLVWGEQEPEVNVFAAPNAAVAGEIIQRFERNSVRWLARPSAKSRPWPIAQKEDSARAHAAVVSRLIPSDQRPNSRMLAVVDSVNCSGADAAQELFAALGARHEQLHGDNSGIFPHTPEPTAENLSGEGGLCDAVPGLKADIGFAQDPDGDRLAIVDETGRYIGEEYTLALCAVSILEAHKAAGKPMDDVMLCANLSTSRMIDDIAARYGASVVRTAVGEANVVEAMKRLKREGKAVLLGGEGNGGVIWPEVTYVRDSLGSMALVLSLMARTGKTVSQLVADIPSYAIVKRKQPLANKSDAQPAIERIATQYASERVDTQDGVRVDFDAKKAWVHVRASNTEPILRLIAEAEDEATANEILDEVAKLVES